MSREDEGDCIGEADVVARDGLLVFVLGSLSLVWKPMGGGVKMSSRDWTVWGVVFIGPPAVRQVAGVLSGYKNP